MSGSRKTLNPADYDLLQNRSSNKAAKQNEQYQSRQSNRSTWAMGIEKTNSAGNGQVSVGYLGAIHITPNGKTTLHRDGKHHHHKGHASGQKKGGSYTSSDRLYSSKHQNMFGSLSAMFERIKNNK